MKRFRIFNIVFCCLLFLQFFSNAYSVRNQNSSNESPNYSLHDNYTIFEATNNTTDYRIQKINQFDTGYGFILDFLIIDGLAFTITHRGELLIFDVSNYPQPLLVGTYNEPRNITEEYLWGNYGGFGNGLDSVNDTMYLCGGLTGMSILNISNPNKLQKIGHYTNEPIIDVIIHQNYAFGLSYPGITIINVTQPSFPKFTKFISDQEFSTGLIYEFAIQDNYLFTLGSDLVIFDISNPLIPIEVARLDVELGKMVVKGDQLFIITSPTASNSYICSLNIINISNPSLPSIISNPQINEIESFVDDIIIENSTIFISSETELFAYNLSFDFKVNHLSTIIVSGSIGEIQIHNISLFNSTEYNFVFCANSHGLQIVDFTNTSHPILLSEYDLGSRTMAVFVDESYVYLSTQHEFPSRPSSFVIVKNVNDDLQFISSFTFVNDVIVDIFVYNHIAYLAGYYNGLIILDLANPYEPVILGTYSEGMSTTKAIFYDHERELIFLANLNNGYSIIDVSNKTNPSLLYNNNPWGISVNNLYIKDELLFLADCYLYGGFVIVDVSDPRNPIYIQAINLGESVFGIYVDEKLLYLSTDRTPLLIYDVSLPTDPIFLGELYTGKWFDGVGLYVDDDLAYLAREENGLMVIDIKNPRKPNLLIEYRDFYIGISYDVVALGEYIFLADGWDGLEILELVPPLISRQQLLLFSILPSLSGSVFVAVIVILQLTRSKRNRRSI